MVRSIFRKQGGFTLLEVLLVVAILAILAGIIIVAINPNKQLADSRNTQRQTDLNTIISAMYQYAVDNNGAMPPAGTNGGVALSATATEICATVTSGTPTCTGLIDLSALVASEKYLPAVPKDPQCSTTCATNGTGYKVSRSANNRITVTAPATENKAALSVTR